MILRGWNILQKMQALANSILAKTFSSGLVSAAQYNIRLVSRVGSGVMLVQSNEATITIATRKCFGTLLAIIAKYSVLIRK